MKRIGISFLVLLSIVSCSWIDTKIKEDIDNKVKEANAAIEDQVKNAQASIENVILNSITKASDNLDSLVKASMVQIEQATDQKVQNSINKEVDKLNSNLSVALWIALLSFFVSTISLALGIDNKLKLRDSRMGDYIDNHMINNEVIKKFINDIIKEKESLSASKNLTNDELKSIIRSSIFTDPKILEYINDRIDKTIGQVSITTTIAQSNAPSVIDKEPKLEQSVQKYELYARDSNTDTLSNIYSSHHVGKTIYKLILDSPNSTTAVLDLCIDKEDAVGRILRFNNEDIESICSVTRNSERPEHISVLRKGRVEKIGQSEWKVIEKIEIELN